MAPNGALIQGSDVTLIARHDLNNAGTLRASNNLAAMAGNDLVNSGLVQAGNRLVNQAGGIIAGRDVTLTAINGDVINERSVTTAQGSSGNFSTSKGYADSAARIEAANNLTIQAGRDVNNIGGVLQSGRDTSISAGRDVNLLSAQAQDKLTVGSSYLDKNITQMSGSISAGRDLSVKTGRDISVIASQIDAKRDITMAATDNLILSSAANEDHFYSTGHHVTKQTDHVSQVGTSLTAGGNVALSAGQDLTLLASRVSAGDEAYLVAGGNLDLLAAQDSDYSLYDMQKKGSFGAKKTQRDEVTDVKNIGSEITSGGDLTLVSGGDQRYQGAKLNSGNDLTLDSGGDITFEAVKDLHQESHEKSNNNAAWVSSKGKGNTDETLHQTQMLAAGDVVIKAVDGLKIDYKHLDQQSVSQAIDAMVKADPNLAWLKEAEQRGDIDWRAVQELHSSYSYSSPGMGPATQLAVAIAAAAIGGMAAAGALSSAGVAGGSFAMGAGVGAAGSLAGTAGVSLINNKGDLGKVLSDSLSSDSLKQMAIASLTGGLTAEYFNGWSGTETNTRVVGGRTIANLNTWEGVGSFAANQGMQNVTSAALSKALDQGGSFNDALKNSFYNTFATAGFNQVGNLGAPASSAQNIAMHALMGGLASVVSGGDFAMRMCSAHKCSLLIQEQPFSPDGELL